MKIKNTLFENSSYYKSLEKIHHYDQLSVVEAYYINRLIKKLSELDAEYSEVKNRLLKQYGTSSEEGKVIIEEDQKEPFLKEFEELLDIEHDLEIEKLAFPNKLENGVSSADLNVMEMFFDLSGLEETKKDESDITTPIEKE